MDIRFVPREEIDKVKWNSCVHYANNGNIFGYIWFLDFVAKDWDALVEGDYESVFPLVWRKDWLGRRTLVQPELMRELGIYSIHALSKKRIRRFLEAIPAHYRRVDITLNEQNRPPEIAGWKVEEKINHQLLLHQSYETLSERFSEGVRELLRQAESRSFLPTSSLKPETIADFYRRHTRERNRERNFHALQRIMYNVLHRGWGFASGIFDEDQELLAANFFIYSHGKVLSLVPVVSPAGQERGALVYLFNLLIQSHAGRPLVLDFNTEVENQLALGFGAESNPYFRIRRG